MTESLLPDGLKSPHQLRGYQIDGVSFLIHNETALLADEMGLGKTVQVITAMRILFQTGQCSRALVVSPSSLQRNWANEFDTWAPELFVRRVSGGRANREAFYCLPLPILLASYEQVRNDSDALDGAPPFDLVVLDEAQRVKNLSSRVSLACRGLRRARSWALSGTPLENSSDDMVALFAFVRRGLIGDGMRASVMHQSIQPYFLRRTKDEATPELPPIIEQRIVLELGGAQRDAYNMLWGARLDSFRSESDDDAQFNLLAMITRLKQVCNHDIESGQSVKLEALKTIVQGLSLANDKVLIFSQYVETLKWLSEMLPEIPNRVFHGGLEDLDRARALDWFREAQGPCVLLMSLKAGGVGLNLQEASCVVLFDRWWNPAVENQAVQRAHRFGRSRPLHVFKFVVAETIEERIEQLLEEKEDAFEAYVGRASSGRGALSRSVLKTLLGIPL